MPRPVALGNGIYHLNIRVPGDLAGKARGTTVTLPIQGNPTTVRIGDKVVVSLRTRDPAEAKTRFAEAEQALVRHWSAIRSGPVTLLHKRVVALAGEVYRRWVALYESSPEMTPERFAEDMRRMEAEIEAWRYDPGGEIDPLSPPGISDSPPHRRPPDCARRATPSRSAAWRHDRQPSIAARTRDRRSKCSNRGMVTSLLCQPTP